MKGFTLLLLGLAVAGVSMLLARFPGVVEAGYGQAAGPLVARWLSLATGWSSFSVAWLLLWLLVGWGGWRLWGGVRAVRAGDLAWGSAFLGGGAWVAGVAGTLLLAFYLFWGLNYARSPVDQRLGWDPPGEADAATLRGLADHALERANQAYRLLHDGAEDAGVPTMRPPEAAQVSRALEVGWRRVVPALGLPAVAARPYGPVKTVGASGFLGFMDISGIYSPFTGEAHVNGRIPGPTFGSTVAHEHAHQRGIARENEATFAGLLAAIHSDDAYLRYAGWVGIVSRLQRDLVRVDAEGWRVWREGVIPGIERDWADYARWREENRGPAGPAASAVNNAYLRSHAVPGGIQNYNRVTELLVAWAARNDGRFTLRPGFVEGG